MMVSQGEYPYKIIDNCGPNEDVIFSRNPFYICNHCVMHVSTPSKQNKTLLNSYLIPMEKLANNQRISLALCMMKTDLFIK